jgi:hypothetical protein
VYKTVERPAVPVQGDHHTHETYLIVHEDDNRFTGDEANYVRTNWDEENAEVLTTWVCNVLSTSGEDNVANTMRGVADLVG